MCSFLSSYCISSLVVRHRGSATASPIRLPLAESPRPLRVLLRVNVATLPRVSVVGKQVTRRWGRVLEREASKIRHPRTNLILVEKPRQVTLNHHLHLPVQVRLVNRRRGRSE